MRLAWLMFLVLVPSTTVLGQAGRPGGVPDGVGFDQRLDAQLPLSLAFRDEEGRAVRLGDYFVERPVILVLAYYECPMLCNLVMDGLVRSVRAITEDAGELYDVVVVSIDPEETSELAAAKKQGAITRYARDGAESAWHFLCGEEESIEALASSVGFRYVYVPNRDEYAHAAGILVATPSGRVSRYFFGVEYPARDLRLSLVEASEGRIGSLTDKLLLFCFHYDPLTGRYSLAIFRLLKVAATLTLLLLVGFIVRSLRQERKARVG